VLAVLTIEKKEHFQKLLSRRLDELLTETNETASGMTDVRDQSPDPLDRASTESDTSFAFRLKAREGNLIRKIEDALSRLEDGTFGICEECGEEISGGRLQARPITTLCIKCKDKQEADEKIRGL
jgi:DnaK suppressor protein